MQPMDEFGMRHPGKREAIIAAGIAALLVIVAWAASAFTGGSGEPPAAKPDSSENAGELVIDVPGEITSEQIADCLPAGTSATEVTIAYQQLQQTVAGTAPAVLLRTGDGELILCDSYGIDRPASVPVELADQANPVRLLNNGRQSWDCDGDALRELTVSYWLSLGPQATSAQMRIVVDDEPGPWFTTSSVDGFAHLHGWTADHSQKPVVRIDFRVRDTAGELIRQETLPETGQPMTACTAGSVDID